MIIIAGKKNCNLCEAAKQKMTLLHAHFEFVDIEDPPENWREIDLAGAMAWHCLHDALPAIRIDGGPWMSYPEAMREIRKGGENEHNRRD